MRVCVLALALTLSLSPSSAFIPSVAPLSGVSKAPAAAFPLRTRTVATRSETLPHRQPTKRCPLAFPNLFGSKPGTATRDAKSELIDLVLSTSRFGTDLSASGSEEGLSARHCGRVSSTVPPPPVSWEPGPYTFRMARSGTGL
eukprot:1835507-Rhodomonas_salina.1